MEDKTMKDKIKDKLDERINYILNKNVESITSEEFSILSFKLNDIENEETKEERNKEYVELLTKVFTK